MLNKIIHFSIANKLVIGIGTIGLIIWGVFSLQQLPIDAVPDITNNQVQVVTSAPSSGAEDIERYVTFPIEQTMATIPEIEEIRSFSRFGLSVVTLVFSENTDIYWAREQVAQRLQEAKNAIPAGLGDPGMAPVSTGLGEIYQYIVKPKPGYEKTYSPAELRSIQDWVIRRQLLGTPGIADVSGFGGFLKQYEVAIKPEVLRSFGISLSELFAALEANNQNTGGAYITKASSTYYIRSEGLTKNLDDIRNVPVKTVEGRPILVRDLADVRYGSAIRYGALTNSDKGEAVGGIVLMLKDANASKVIEEVKSRMEQIKKTLPEGVEVEVYLDRTKLVDKAIHTVSTNLIEGALIVIFILVLLLGNLRAGLIVASVIPLAMLFAVSMMNVFGVSGNLMSLGAIDFGLIVDGAVIIVEATLHHLVLRRTKHVLSQKELDHEVQNSATKIMKSAAFGEIIILIVYLPLLTLVGIEGKMFAPMAQTVIFAIIGAFILSLTYVPMISALVLSKKPLPKKTLSDRLVTWIQNRYEPSLNFVIRNQKVAIVSVVALLITSIFLFRTLGAEFIPTLDEGDFAVEVRGNTGGSLEYMVDASTKAARILQTEFPDEVKTCVGKIGTAEIPTDPMPMEACDLMIILKDRDQWKKAQSREELAEKMQAVLDDNIPGISFSFQQPIQMRFNEMMAGAKQDVVVKIYGEDLNMLSQYAEQVGGIVSTIDGATDVYVEQVTGLPQMLVKVDRQALARFGISVESVNQAINMGFAGQPAGQVFEGEKRFDLVVRLDGTSRKSIQDLQNLTVLSNQGIPVPINQLAEVKLENGPNQIQRDDAKRRIIVGFNVRGRDVNSIVQELQAKVDKNVKFDTGYYPTYGGTYKNLEKASARLSIAVPIALFLILFLLYATFQSVQQALLIFSAIPLAAIGGIIALWLRGMPFSISAGVGFIALFGVAVLNGIVLVAEFNRLKQEKTANGLRVILAGTRVRLRPVLMTAMVASLGFLPMAISTGSGAEVQKPLATVVIGGLITATFLTLFLLPVLYHLVDAKSYKKRQRKSMKTIAPILLVFFGLNSAFGQTTSFSLNECITQAKSNNLDVQAAKTAIDQALLDRKALVPTPKTNVTFMMGQYNSANKTDNNITVQQSIPFPTAYAKGKRVGEANAAVKTLEMETLQWQIEQNVRRYYEELCYLDAQYKLAQSTDSIYVRLENMLQAKQLAGDVSPMEVQLVKINRIKQEQAMQAILLDKLRVQTALQSLMHSEVLLEPKQAQYNLLSIELPSDSLELEALPVLLHLKQQQAYYEAEIGLKKALILPDLTFGYFNQTLIGTQTINGQEVVFNGGDRFQGFSVGTAIPIFTGAERAQIKQQQLMVQQTEQKYQSQSEQLTNQLQLMKSSYAVINQQLVEWEEAIQPMMAVFQQQILIAFKEGEVDLNKILLNEQEVVNQENERIRLVYLSNSIAHQLAGFTKN
ncbi:MAG: CusA/CzcA family heavy metal efflux RND transporter [Fluviicola sp.]|nr:CusA/CzcA family heavy metal efflux RND transporter [Fluviicola sp.]